MTTQPQHLESTSCFAGGPLSGKTQRLVSRTRDLVERGASSILVLCANDWLVRRFSERLAEAAGTAASTVTVTTPLDYAEAIVREPEAQALTGRTGRVMQPHEEKLFFEDMRTTTMKGRRLREMLGFIYRQRSELNDEHDWDATFEETQVIDYARRILEFNGGILSCELPGFALAALQESERLRETYRRAHVLVDDYNALGRGMQVLATHLATTSLAVAGDETPCGAVCDEHPYAKGISELLVANPEAQVTHLERDDAPEGIARALARVSASMGDAAALEGDPATLPAPRAGTGIGAQSSADMGEELRAIAYLARDARQAGKTMLVCGTHRVWRANVQRALVSVGFDPQAPAPPIRVRDFGDEKACRRARADARRRLVADPHDSVAWRSIVGLGDYVGRSDALQELREATEDDALGIEQALEALSEGRARGIDPEGRSITELVSVYRAARKALEGGTWETADADAAPAPSPFWQEAPLAIADPRDCYGAQADIVVFGGFVDGLIPSRDFFDESKTVGSKIELERTRDLQSIHLVAGRAREQLVFTGFERASLETAERMGLRIERIKLRGGIRMCSIAPSVFLRDIGLS